MYCALVCEYVHVQYIQMHVNISIFVHMCAHTHVPMFTGVKKDSQTHECLHMCIQVHIQVCVYVHMYVEARSWLQMSSSVALQLFTEAGSLLELRIHRII